MYSTRRLVKLGCARRDGRAESRGALYPTVGYGFVSSAVVGRDFVACRFFANGRPDTIGLPWAGWGKSDLGVEKAATARRQNTLAPCWARGGIAGRISRQFFDFGRQGVASRQHCCDASTIRGGEPLRDITSAPDAPRAGQGGNRSKPPNTKSTHCAPEGRDARAAARKAEPFGLVDRTLPYRFGCRIARVFGLTRALRPVASSMPRIGVD